MKNIKIKIQFLKSFFLLLITYLPFLGSEGSETAKVHFTWKEIPPPPISREAQDQIILRGAFSGVHNGVYMIAGGIRTDMHEDTEENIWSDKIYILEKNVDGGYKWKSPGNYKLPRPLGQGVALSTEEGILCIGGRDENECFSDVFLLRWDNDNQNVEIETKPSLPRPLALMSGAKIGNSIYIAGGQESIKNARATNNFWTFNIAQENDQNNHWRELSSWPGPARLKPVVFEQSDGAIDAFYLFGGLSLDPEREDKLLTDNYHFNPILEEWKHLAVIDSMYSLRHASAVSYGANHVLFFSGTEQQLLAYHTITDTCVKLSDLPERGDIGTNVVLWDRAFVFPLTSSKTDETAMKFWEIERQVIYNFGWLNYSVIIIFFVLLLFMGWFFSKREKNTDDYFKAGKRVPWWAAGISIIGTGLSALTFMSVPAKAYSTDWVYAFSYFFAPILAPVIVYAYLPFFRRLNVTTAYEYLELRFNLPVRLISSFTFILFQIGRVSVILLLPSIALSVATGINIFLSITVLGIISTIYTVMGGIEAVVWTDVIQVIILLMGALISLVIIVFYMDGDFSGMYITAMEDNKLHLVDFAFDLTMITFWAVIFSLPAGLASVADQATIQRYLTTKDEKNAAKSIWMTAFISPIMGVLFFIIGTALYLFYKEYPLKLTPGLEQTDATFPLFIVTEIPAGLSGLIIAAIFAAAMSSLDSSIHSSSTAIVTDFYRRLKKEVTDAQCLRLARVLIAIFGVFGTGLALYMGQFDIKSIWDIFIQISNLLTGGLTGIFVLAVFTKRANATGVLIGFFASAIILYLVKSYTDVHFFWYTITGMGSCLIVGYLASLILPAEQKSLDGLTFYNMRKRID